MKEKIVNNIGLKMLSFVLAVILWVTIINVIDPSDDKIISGIQVELLNQDTLTNQGYTYEILDGNMVSISVNGPKSKISGLTSQDFYASADFSTISPPLSVTSSTTPKTIPNIPAMRAVEKVI